MITNGGVGARQASVDGVGGRAVTRVGAVLCWLSALVLAVVFSDGLDWAWWELSAGIGVLLLMVLIGLVMWFGAARAKEDTTRLGLAGRPAIAEIVGLDVDGPGDGSAEIAVLSLRISGDGVPPFEATYRCDHGPEFEVGARVEAVVDPSDNLFTLKPTRR